MEVAFFLIVYVLAGSYARAKLKCDATVIPLEIGSWSNALAHMDSVTVENPPVSLKEGQVYVYENYFPNRTIKYIHVDNLARKSCGASASIKSGGVGTSMVLIVLQAAYNQEIRTVIDIWGTQELKLPRKPIIKYQVDGDPPQHMQSLYLFKDYRTVNHNTQNTYEYK